MFYDEETGWYYNGRYYDCGANRYVDGISPEMANELEDIYGYRALIRSYEFGLPYVHSEKARYSASMDSVEIVGRVFYCEAGTSTSDWDAVAWAVYNRMKSTGRTAFSIVTNGDFSAFNNGSYMFSTSGWYNTTKFYRCIENSELLNNNEKPFAEVSYISNQKNFRSISTFSDKYSSDGYTQKFDGVEIKNVVIPGVGIIGADTRSINKLNYESCQFNFYFDYYYE